MKSRDLVAVYCVAIVLVAGCSAVCFNYNLVSGIVTLSMGVVIIVAFSLYLFKKYKQIQDISDYLTTLVNGSDNLRAECNREGEFSILTNNIYKTAKRLKTQTELLYKDKNYLAEFMADISHQLKTPITSMMVMIDLLQDENIEPEIRKKFLNNINNELEKTQWLIVMLLKHSKIDSGTVVIKNNKINLADVIKEALSSFLVQADMRNIAINTNINDSFIEGDYNWSVEAFENIIKNCIEHMENGGKLDITCVQTSIYSKVVIKDNGCGIDKEDLPHIFERFYRGKNSSKDSVGIGLSLSKAIISREKGTIDVTSEINVGTTFSIKFYSSIV